MRTLYKYLIAFGFGLAAVGVIAYQQELFTKTEYIEIIHVLINCFTVPAVLITGIGGLIFVSNEGGFDIMSYGMMCFLDMFRKQRKNTFKSFYDYKESRAEKNVGFGFWLVTGLVFMVITGILCLMYFNA